MPPGVGDHCDIVDIALIQDGMEPGVPQNIALPIVGYNKAGLGIEEGV